MQFCTFLTSYCSFLGQQKLNYLELIGKLVHYKYVLTLVLFMKRGMWNYGFLKISLFLCLIYLNFVWWTCKKLMKITQLLILCSCFKNSDLILHFRYKGCKYPTHIYSFLSSSPRTPLSSACHSHTCKMCIIIIYTYTQSGFLRHGWGYHHKHFLFPLALIIKYVFSP